uniref:Uncharacterized protein n=1 Tax=Aromatoleum toluolicum TaxID=90060 RepID=A0ABX1NJR7_9RHOO|nr:hypothetical protein [Aromatoleum toluolicum]
MLRYTSQVTVLKCTLCNAENRTIWANNLMGRRQRAYAWERAQ